MNAPATLWAHQARGITVCQKAHRRPRSKVLIQFPAGAGKSEVAAQLALQHLQEEPFGRVLIIAPSEPILLQFYDRLAFCAPCPVHIEKAERWAPVTARLVLASQNSIWDRLHRYPEDVLTIYDECHHANLDATENLRVARGFHHVVGLSATPWSTGCEELFGQPTVFLSLREALKLRDAQGRGVLAPYELLPWTEPKGPHGLVFCASNEECRRWCYADPGGTWITYDLGAEVRSRVAAWRAGRHPVLYANLIPREGLDSPECGAVWIAKPSESDILRVQMVGRALRWQPGKVAKVYCLTEEIREGVAAALDRCNEAPVVPLRRGR